MAFLVAGASYGVGRGEAGEKHERGETRPGASDGRGDASEEVRGGGRETRLGTATPERAINDSGAEFRDAEILSV